MLWLTVALLAPLLAPFSPLQQNLKDRLHPPDRVYLFGADEVGLFSRVLYGARISLPVALMVVAISGTLGIALGAVVGFVGGWTDEIIMRLADPDPLPPRGASHDERARRAAAGEGGAHP
jgi:peptide/nickel transport system permease protein